MADEAKRIAAIEAARLRRVAAASRREVRFRWFLDEVSDKVSLTMKQRVRMATEFLRDKVVRNISRPVTKTVHTYWVQEGSKLKKRQRTVVSNRSKPGEFPKADTTLLMKSIFGEVRDVAPGVCDGFVGTPLDYGLELELRMNRSFLVRTLREERGTIDKILTGPIK